MALKNKQLVEVKGKGGRHSRIEYFEHLLGSAISAKVPSGRGFLSHLEALLLAWAEHGWPECFDAAATRLDDAAFVRKCCGTIFRRVGAADPQFPFWAAAELPRDVVSLGRHIRTFRSGGQELPGRDGWAWWVEGVGMADLLDLAGPPTLAAIQNNAPADEARPTTPPPQSVAAGTLFDERRAA